LPAGWEPERPIVDKGQDRLERGGFVLRLVDALVSRTARRSTGVVVGIVGPWGSGKSSVLNLLEDQLRASYPRGVVVRFDPWLVGGRDDLITQFMKELLAAIRSRRGSDPGWRKLATAMLAYSDALEPIGKMVSPTLGDLAAATTKAIRARVEGEESIRATRLRVDKALQTVRAPIVVLIDELDRIEDHEVRTVAQLVRAVADFPGVSYVLAYDHDRVVQALGVAPGVGRRERNERGRAYLEKIVQLAVPLPITFADEMRTLLEGELEPLIAEGMITLSEVDRPRFRDICELLSGAILATPRDVKRCVGAFRIIRAMTTGEVDWIDVLGYSALKTKAPSLAKMLQDDFDRFVDNPASEVELVLRATAASGRAVSYPPSEDTDAIKRLVEYIFPAISSDGYDRKSHPDPISNRRALLAVLRLGLRTGEIEREKIDILFTLPTDQVSRRLAHFLAEGGIADISNRIDDIYADHRDPADFWIGVTDFLKPEPTESDVDFLSKRDFANSMSMTLLRSSYQHKEFKEINRNTMNILSKIPDLSVFPITLWRHFFAYGIFNQRRDGPEGAFISESEVYQWAALAADEWKEIHLKHHLVTNMVHIAPIVAMMNMSRWDAECRDSLAGQMSSNLAFDRFMLMAFGGNSFTDNDWLDGAAGAGFVRQRAQDRLLSLEGGPDRPILRSALNNFVGGVFG